MASDAARSGFRWRSAARTVLGTTVCLALLAATVAAAWMLRHWTRLTVVPPFLLTVMLAAWRGGVARGVAILVAASAAYGVFFIEPSTAIYSAVVDDPVDLAEFATAGLLILALTTALQRATAAEREASRKLRDLNEHLEIRVAERTRELEAFSYTVAHDLRAPLRAMAGFSQALLEDYADRPLDAGGQDYARRIADAGIRMDLLIQNLLSYSRIGREPMELESVDLTTLVAGVVERMRPEISRRNAEVETAILPGIVRANPESAARAVSNLLSNALKFVPPGRVPVVRLRSERRGSTLRLWVEDNGIGIAKEYQARIFGVFERLHRREEYAGTGIGLAIVKKAVERMGGSTGVESRPGEGSRFWIELGAAPEPAGIPVHH